MCLVLILLFFIICPGTNMMKHLMCITVIQRHMTLKVLACYIVV